ncbi:HDOD domain-containing protein [Oleidesulfovibrio sp.]|uniref:HDOD domain-containing protein n=1 Tax=Oleidesulfovibrio sp. TaxID=2909707 RepID=UPI003A875E9A
MDCLQLDDVQRDWLRHRFKAADAGHPAIAALHRSVSALIASDASVVRADWRVPAADAAYGIPRLCSRVPLPPEQDDCEDLLASILENARLPALPIVFHKLQQQLEDPDTSVDDVAWTISMDPKLTVSLLRLVNSAFFGLKVHVETVSRAVAILGAKRLSALATGTLLLGLFHERPPQAIDVDEFWRHSVACGLAARTIGICIGRETPERLFVAGLLHDIGWLALCCERPDLACGALRESAHSGDMLHECEQRVLGFDHGVLGYRLAAKWNLPPAIASAIAWHHEPEKAVADSANALHMDDVDIVHFADLVVHAMGASITCDQFVPRLDPQSWERLGMAPEHVGMVVHAVATELEMTLELLRAEAA